MNCNSQIHDELKNMMESTCPFCDQQLVEVKNVTEPCCSEQHMETVNGMNICINCGLVDGYDFINEYIDFYDNMYRIQRKSVYHRKYHIENVLFSISSENNIYLNYCQKEKIHKVFVEIDSVLHKVDYKRKRMISIKFIVMQLFKMLGLPYKDIQVTKSKRKLKDYEKYWEKVESSIGDRIQSIINM